LRSAVRIGVRPPRLALVSSFIAFFNICMKETFFKC
jgi:hypothetical protein